MKEITLTDVIKEKVRKLEERELKRYLRYYHLNDVGEMSEEQLEEFCNYFTDVEFRFTLSLFDKFLKEGTAALK